MRILVRFPAIALGLAIVLTGCASPPTADVDAAKAALDKATTDRAGQYATESLKAAQDARAALDVELKAQEAKWLKSYDRPRNSQSLRRRRATKRRPMLPPAKRKPTWPRPKASRCRGQGKGQRGGAPHRRARSGHQ